jgi:hypothetical protein
MALPECGLYLTTKTIGNVAPGRLVYFHNHGDPEPGIYLPTSWHLNRATFDTKGTPLVDHSLADTLKPLPREGLYQVESVFTCCDKNCRSFEKSLLVQLGYNGGGDAILFVPKWTETGLSFPERGQFIDSDRVKCLVPLLVESPAKPKEAEPTTKQYLH